MMNILTRQFLIIAAAALLVRVWTAYTETTPLWLDELAHGNYVAYVHEHWSLPDTAIAKEDIPPGSGRSLQVSYEHYQPPGYYILAAVFSGGSPLGARLVSVTMFMIALCFVWAGSRDPGIAWILSLLPGIIYATSVIGNDVFLLLGSAIMFYACARKKTWAFVLGGVVLATSKFHGIPILGAVAIYYFLKQQRHKAGIALVCAVIGIAIVWWRWDLQKVNDASFKFITPKISLMTDMISQTIASGVMHITPYELGQFSYILAVPIGLFLIYKAYCRMKHSLPVLNLAVIGIIMLVWLVFSLTHEAWQGRLLYAAIPWLAVRGSKVVRPSTPTPERRKSKRQKSTPKR